MQQVYPVRKYNVWTTVADSIMSQLENLTWTIGAASFMWQLENIKFEPSRQQVLCPG